MGDFYDQAQAIWSALDAMAEQDPEGYKKFISEQLQQGKSEFGKSGKSSTSNASDIGEKGIDDPSGAGLPETFRKLSMNTFGMEILGHGSSPALDKGKALMGGRKADKMVGHEETIKANASPFSNRGGGDADGNLLDNEIGIKPSMISQIVTSKDLQYSKEQGEIEDEVPINELVIPTGAEPKSSGSRTTKQPLIEEL